MSAAGLQRCPKIPLPRPPPPPASPPPPSSTYFVLLQGSKVDHYHTECHKDRHDIHSTCGSSVVGFGADHRLNEEWFGLYNTSYADVHQDWLLSLTPRPAVAGLQALWNRTGPAAPPSTAPRREAQTGSPGPMTVLFPRTWNDLFSAWVVVVLCIALMLVMCGLVMFPRFVPSHLRRQSQSTWRGINRCGSATLMETVTPSLQVRRRECGVVPPPPPPPSTDATGEQDPTVPCAGGPPFLARAHTRDDGVSRSPALR